MIATDFAVIELSPVAIITLIPADYNYATAYYAVYFIGSLKSKNPTNVKFFLFKSNLSSSIIFYKFIYDISISLYAIASVLPYEANYSIY